MVVTTQQHQINYEGLTLKILVIVALVWPPLRPIMSNNAQQDAQQCWELLSESLRWFGRGLTIQEIKDAIEKDRTLQVYVQQPN